MENSGAETPAWQVLGRKTIYHSPWVSLHTDRVKLPDGSIIEEHHVIDFPRPAVGVVACNAGGQILLVEQYRFISKERGWGIPSGGVDRGEALDAAARREMLEETGSSGGELVLMGEYRPSIGSTNQLFVLYFARNVVQTSPVFDRNEVIQVRWFSAAELRELLDRNAIKDGLSLTALLLAFYKGLL